MLQDSVTRDERSRLWTWGKCRCRLCAYVPVFCPLHCRGTLVQQRLRISVRPTDSAAHPTRLARCQTQRICTTGGPCPAGSAWVLAGHRPRPAPPLQEHRFCLPQPFWLQHLCLNQTGSLRDGLSSWGGWGVNVVCARRPKAGGRSGEHSGVCPVTSKAVRVSGRWALWVCVFWLHTVAHM